MPDHASHTSGSVSFDVGAGLAAASSYHADLQPGSGNAGGIMRTPAAAKFLGVSTSCLAKWRVRGEGPPFVRLGRKAVGYQVEDLRAWLRAGRRASTSDVGSGGQHDGI